jgi:hypothetical protein
MALEPETFGYRVRVRELWGAIALRSLEIP